MQPLTVTDGYVPFECGTENVCRTYYKRVVAEPARTGYALIVIHGGPTFGHNYMLPLQELARLDTVQSVIFYDQIGCGKSTKLPEKKGDSTFWTIDLLQRELANIVDHLNEIAPEVNGQHAVMGHSVGALMGSLFASAQPPNLHKLVLLNGLASLDLLHKSNLKLMENYPVQMRESIIESEEFINGTRADCRIPKEDYMAGLNKFRSDYAISIPFPFPDTLMDSLKNVDGGEDSLKGFAGGRVELFFGGSLAAVDARPVLPKITVPTLVLNGERDKASAMTSQPFVDLIPNTTRVIVANTSHLTHYEDPDGVLRHVSEFLSSPN